MALEMSHLFQHKPVLQSLLNVGLFALYYASHKCHRGVVGTGEGGVSNMFQISKKTVTVS